MHFIEFYDMKNYAYSLESIQSKFTENPMYLPRYIGIPLKIHQTVIESSEYLISFSLKMKFFFSSVDKNFHLDFFCSILSL